MNIFALAPAALVPALALLAVTGCRQPPARNEATRIDVPEGDYLERITALPAGQRDAVFQRAINDAGLDCQAVTGSAAGAPVQGRPTWVAHCEDGHDWVVVLEKAGIVQIATPAQIDEARGEPGGSAGQPAGNGSGG